MSTKLQDAQHDLWQDTGSLARAESIMLDLARRYGTGNSSNLYRIFREIEHSINNTWRLKQEAYPKAAGTRVKKS